MTCDLWNIRTLPLVQEDGDDPRLEAKDILFNLGFERSGGGVVWHRSGAEDGGGGDGVVPYTSQVPKLALLDQTQTALDIANEQHRVYSWNCSLCGGSSSTERSAAQPTLKRQLA